MISADRVWLLAAALLVDAVAGDPDVIWRRIPHPVVAIGRLVGLLDEWMNRDADAPTARRMAGVAAIAVVVTVAALAGFAVERLLAEVPYGWLGTAAIASVLLAGRSLYDHVSAVAAAFEGGLGAARVAVSRIVGRDTDGLSEPQVCRAAIESLAESVSDGVVAPAFWFLLLGLPGMAAYKAINTADSMIGHRTSRHEEFGWAAARLDDLVNLPASRIAGVLLALAAPLAGGSAAVSFGTMLSDARLHRSPNAGWPEAAMAGATGVALGGPRRYGGVIVDDPFINGAGRADATPDDIGRALRVYAGAWAALAIGVAAAGALVLLR